VESLEQSSKQSRDVPQVTGLRPDIKHQIEELLVKAILGHVERYLHLTVDLMNGAFIAAFENLDDCKTPFAQQTL
jgi:hypothetical protein